jgi:hypothetical protein
LLFIGFSETDVARSSGCVSFFIELLVVYKCK